MKFEFDESFFKLSEGSIVIAWFAGPNNEMTGTIQVHTSDTLGTIRDRLAREIATRLNE